LRRRSRKSFGPSAEISSSSKKTCPSVGSISYAAELRIEDVLRRPFHLIGLVVTDLVKTAPRYGAHFIGHLGWLDTELPLPLLLTYAACLLAFVVLDRDPSIVIAPCQRAIWAFAVVASLMAIGAAMYLFLASVLAALWGYLFNGMPVGWPFVAGGALVLAGLLLMALQSRRAANGAHAAPESDRRSEPSAECLGGPRRIH